MSLLISLFSNILKDLLQNTRTRWNECEHLREMSKRSESPAFIKAIYNNFLNFQKSSPKAEWSFVTVTILTLFRMGLFGAAHGYKRSTKKASLPNFCHTYSTMMKLGTVIHYLNMTPKYLNHVTFPLSSADINFCYIKKYRYRLMLNF